MIDIQGISKVWKCSPKLVFNESRGLVVNIRLAALPDLEAKNIADMNRGPEAINAEFHEFVSQRVEGFENLKIDGKEIKTYKELVATGAYHQLVGWCQIAVKTEQWLSDAEIKNSSPESATDSTAD